MRLDPISLGYFEKRPRSGIWYHLDKAGAAFEPRVCQNSDCEVEFMGSRGKTATRFCSRACWYKHEKRTSGATYSPLHKRVHRARGSARGNACVECGRQAQEWSQIHDTDGTDPGHYEPRCWECHAYYDGRTGEGHHAAKLSDVHVLGIYASVGVKNTELAKIHGVTPTTIGDIRSGRTRRDVTGGKRVTW